MSQKVGHLSGNSRMSGGESEVWARVERVLCRLVVGTKGGGTVEDDTVLHKLHSHLHHLLHHDKNGRVYVDSCLLPFVRALLDPTIASSSSNAATVALALKVLASVVSVQQTFDDTLAEDKVMCQLVVLLPTVRSDATLLTPTLSLVEAIMQHTPGVYWLLKTGVWEKVLLPCLRSNNIFVQRQGVTVIASLIMQLSDTQHFERFIKDLLLISDKICELRRHVGKTEGEELRQSNLCVMRVFQRMYIQALGKTTIYSQISSIDDMNARLLLVLSHKIPISSVTCITDVLFLNMLHKFQEKLIGYGILEQFLVDSLCADLISLTRLLLEQGNMESFFRSSVNIHKYWQVMCKNLKQTKNIDMDSGEALLHIVTAFQMTPILLLYRCTLELMLKVCPEKRMAIKKLEEDIHGRIQVKEEVKAEADKLEKQIVEVLGKDPEEAVRMAVLCISAFSNAKHHLNEAVGVTVFQGLVLLLVSQECQMSPIRHHAPLQRAVIDGLRILVEKFDIDWRKSYVSVCLTGKLCEMIKLPGISTQVKVSTLKALNSCIEAFIPPVMSMLMNSEKLETNSVELLGQVLTIYLGDLEWEVRDSALEILITCMKLAVEKYPPFVDWMLRYRLNQAVVSCLGDVEGYVRASACLVLANVTPIDKVWVELEKENLPHRALACVLHEGDAAVRKAAILLVEALFRAGKYSEEEVDGLVMRVIQHAADDTDDEVRSTALSFMHVHILWMLNKAGMVDGEFPAVTFSKGKIIKLDKEEVKNRIHKILIWLCDCGYMCCILTCLKDLVSCVVSRARCILCCIKDLITRYQIQLEGSAKKRKVFSDASNSETKKTEDSVVVTVAGQPVTVSKTGSGEVDRVISDILGTSALDSVSVIKRPMGSSVELVVDPKMLLTLDSVPAPNPPISVTSLLHSIEGLCLNNTSRQGESEQMGELVSLLDDIMLDGSHSSHLDDQRLRDCY